jgi:plasmid stabilization system protein ParE
MPPTRKGLQDIRTHAGRSTAPGSSHRTYIRLSTLEMERTRRQQEFEAAQARADAAKARVQRLEAEIAEIVAAISNGTPVPPPRELPNPHLISVKHAYGVSRRVPETDAAANEKENAS